MSEKLKDLIAKVADGLSLDADEAEAAFDVLMSGEALPSQVGGFLMALRLRGETVTEIAAAVRVMRRKMVRVDAPVHAIDIVGTGGDGKGTLNISTAAAFVAAGAGLTVAKHGNRKLSSLSGAGDLLAAYGVNLETPPEIVSKAIREVGVGFMLAPRYHDAIKHVAPTRQALGVRTVFNLLGPLTNPAGVERQLTGVFASHWLRPMAETLRALGSTAAWLAHGADGTDELSISGPSKVVALKAGEISEFEVHPEDAGLSAHRFESILGGAPERNVAAFRALLDGAADTEPARAYRDAVVLNAAAALVMADRSADLKDAAELAADSLDSGRAKAAADGLARITSAVPA